MKREFLQLAQTFNPNKHLIAGWYASEKLDGMRAFWDGGWSRGKLASEVPYANTTKDFARIHPVRATGLWSRYAKPIQAPPWFLDELPNGVLLDGELYIGPGRFQDVISTVKKIVPVHAEWLDIRFRVFDFPSYEKVFAPGRINNPNHKAEMPDCRHLFTIVPQNIPGETLVGRPFYQVIKRLDAGELFPQGSVVQVHDQIRLPSTTEAAQRVIDEMMDTILAKKGEGIIVRKPESIWTPERTWSMLKIKPDLDAEAYVVGWTLGKGKLDGLMGALTVNYNGKTFNLSGFTDEERRLLDTGEPAHFARGQTVTFKYRELTDDGIPKEARYHRKAR
jgi:DNA ligase 1